VSESSANPKVSILIPVYNREDCIEGTLKSAVDQRYDNLEIIVVDNRSTDGTLAILQEFAKRHANVRVFQNTENIGPVRNWRKCLENATGEYVKILWSDDLIAPDFVRKTIPLLMENEDVGFVFTGTEIFNGENPQRQKMYFIGDTGVYDSEQFIKGCLLDDSFPVSPGNAVFRRKDLLRNLLIDIPNKLSIDFTKHGAGPDVLMFLLATKEYPKFGFVNEPLALYRNHRNSITNSTGTFSLLVSYCGAMAFFLDHHTEDRRLIRRFNSRLLFVCLKNRLWKEYRSLSIRDFYSRNDCFKVDGMFFAVLAWRSFWRKFASNGIR
jgi:glycosyltransferase involved in cell wall biosynthesis